MDRPFLPQSTFTSVTETLVLWIARGGACVQTDVQGWRVQEWQAALWVAYWQAAMPLWFARLGEVEPVDPGARRVAESIAALCTARTERLLAAVQQIVTGL